MISDCAMMVNEKALLSVDVEKIPRGPVMSRMSDSG